MYPVCSHKLNRILLTSAFTGEKEMPKSKGSRTESCGMTLPWIERSPFVNSVSCVRQPVIYLAVFIWLFVKLEEFIYDTTLLGSVNGLAEYTVSSMHHQTFIQGFSELLEENN